MYCINCTEHTRTHTHQVFTTAHNSRLTLVVVVVTFLWGVGGTAAVLVVLIAAAPVVLLLPVLLLRAIVRVGGGGCTAPLLVLLGGGILEGVGCPRGLWPLVVVVVVALFMIGHTQHVP